MSINPIIKADYPDPDVIRVKDTYYMVSTTMHFFPGGAVLRSYDLVNWEIINYIFNELDNTPEEHLERELNAYAGCMWAPSFRYHNGTFYVAFVSHFTEKTYLFTTKDIEGAWEKHIIEGYYHDCSLLFDDDRVFIVSGNGTLYIQELESDLSGPKKNGFFRKLVLEQPHEGGLGYEGSHLYKINGKYYLFLIHWLPTGNARRTEACYIADSLDGEFVGGDIFDDDRKFCNQGVAQGGIVDTPNGKWYAVLFQDSGAVGRMPILVPMHFENDIPVIGVNGKVPERFEVASTRPYYRYEPMYTSDIFEPNADNTSAKHPKIKLQWQWNHIPDENLWYMNENRNLVVKTGKICPNLTQAVNCLTQRMMWPRCEAEVTIDASNMKDGDIAGLCVLQGKYGYLAISKATGCYYLTKMVNNTDSGRRIGALGDYMPGDEVERIRLDGPKVTVCLKAVFDKMTDKLDFFYLKDGKYIRVGNSHDMQFRLDHFTGARFGLFIYSTRNVGGEAEFSQFTYRYYD